MKSPYLSSKLVLFPIGIFILIFLFQACTIGPKRSRGRLSDAMEKASDKNRGSRRVEPSTDKKDHTLRPGLSLLSSGNNESKEEPPIASPDPAPDDPEREFAKVDEEPSPFGLSGGIGLLKSDDFAELIGVDVSMGFPDKRCRSEFYIGAAWSGVDSASELDSSIDNGVFLFNFGFNFKLKLSEDPQWNSPYIMVGAAYRRMWWAFENHLVVPDGDDIHSDSLDGFEIASGFGKKLLKHDNNSLGIEIYPSVLFWLPKTTEGFKNDVFDPFFMLNVRMIYSSW